MGSSRSKHPASPIRALVPREPCAVLDSSCFQRAYHTNVKLRTQVDICARLTVSSVQLCCRPVESQRLQPRSAQLVCFHRIGWSHRLAAGRVCRYRRLVRAKASTRPQPNRGGNSTRTRTGWDACGYLARDLAEHAARRCRSAYPSCDPSQMKASAHWAANSCGLEPSLSRSLLPGVAAVLVVMLAPVRSTLRRGLTFCLPRRVLRASSALYEVRRDTPSAAAGFGPE